jgi:glutamate 5-kinase
MRIVVKVGTHVLSEQNRLDKERMANLVEFLVQLMEKHEVILVSSAAIAAGYTKLKLDKKSLTNRQALAAVGQPHLIEKYNKKLALHGKMAGQILLGSDDFKSEKRTERAKCAIDTLIKNSVLPIINENDATSIEEIVFGDNDQLSAHVTHYFDADLLIMLSDIDGYYDKDPNKNSDAIVHKVVYEIQKSELELSQNPNTEFATGGIVTKLKAANFLLQRNKSMFMSSGFDLRDVKSYMFDGMHKGGTLFTCKIVK